MKIIAISFRYVFIRRLIVEGSIFLWLLFMVTGCSKDPENNNPPVAGVPVVTTATVSDISQSYAACGGTVTSQGSSAVVLRGVCWSTNANPVVSDNHTTDGDGTGSFTSYIYDLAPGTIYFARAYAINANGTGYGEIISFKTLAGPDTIVVNMSIKALLDSFIPDTLNNSCMMIKGDTVIEGTVTANDKSGNIYKILYIQDNTAGIPVWLDQSNLYSEYSVGQKIKIKCKGLFLGTMGGVLCLGIPYQGAIGRIPSHLISEYLFKDGLPGSAPEPVKIDLSTSLFNKISMLVRVDSISFPDAGLPFCEYGNSTNRELSDKNGVKIIIGGYSFVLRTSNYASFAYSLLPYGTGSLIGILGAYNGQYQMMIRDTTDLIDFSSSANPNIYIQNFDKSPADWLTYSVSSNKDWAWNSVYFLMEMNGYSGDVPSEDWLISPGIDLTGISNGILTFKTWTKYTDTGNSNPLEIFLSTDYSGSGDPSSATWIKVNCTLPTENSSVWTGSGDIDLSSYQQKICIGFRYRSSGITGVTAAKWEIDSFHVYRE